MAAINNVKTAQHDPRIGRFEEWIRLRRYPRYLAECHAQTVSGLSSITPYTRGLNA